MAVGQLYTVARVEDVPPGSARAVRAGERDVALFNVGGSFHATQGNCLHLGGPLGEGRLDDCVVTCPWHGWQYDVRTGENEFDRALVLETFDVVVEDGDVKVVLSELGLKELGRE
jgi:nitrite reductase/ring-hydroxylating ferredoxin subunit